MLELCENVKYTFIAIAPGPLWLGMAAPDRFLCMGQIEVNCVLMLNWIVWNRTVYMYKNGFSVKYNGWYAIKPNQTKPNQT